MSKDIRSFFSVVAKKQGDKKVATTPAKKRTIKLSDSEEEDLPKEKNKQIAKKRKVNKVILSDSDDEAPQLKTPEKKKSLKEKKNDKLQPVAVSKFFGSSPIKQSKVDTKELSGNKDPEISFLVDDDDDFEKTLIQLDEEDIVNNASSVRNEKTPKASKTDNLNESGIDPDQERFERRKQNYASYQKYLHRGQPQHLGQKEYPKGKADSLHGICFIRTGVLDSLDGEAFEKLIKEHGGRIVQAVSRKVNYVVIGEEPGPAKLAKAESFGIPTITEDELLDIILVKSGMEPKYVQSKGKEEHKNDVNSSNQKEGLDKKKQEIKPDSKSNESKTTKHKLEETSNGSPKKKAKTQSNKQPVALNAEPVTLLDKEQPRKLTQCKDLKPIEKDIAETDSSNLPWTDKYQPQSLKQIIGQQGTDSPMNKLKNWLENWYKTLNAKSKGPRGFADSFKCALLSGPPGVGKTTTATLVAKELGFDVVEFNASDTRNKRLLSEQVSKLLETKSLATYFASGAAPTSKHVLLMDEVDGMSGNEDRGGMQELIALIKKSHIPVICMCNDRYNQKIASLSNYCLDLRFTKPKMEQIRGALMSICFKENIKLSSQAIAEIILGTDNDVRQSLTHLSFFTSDESNLNETKAKIEAANSHKDVQLGPWEVCRKVFARDESMRLADKCKLFFYDYSLGPLFVHENYKSVDPGGSDIDKLRKAAASAHAISFGDRIDSLIRGSNNWSLLELQAVHSSVLPGHYMQGGFAKQIAFPRWLGSNSRRNKYKRLLAELESHMLTSSAADAEGINLDYLPLLNKKLLNCLLVRGMDGVEDAVNVLNAYDLTREDLDSIMELADYHNKKAFASVETKVKSAFTRTYNKTCQKLPYALASNKKRIAPISDDVEEAESDNESEDGDITKDKMIMVKKKVTAKKADEKKEGPLKKGGTSKGRKAK